MKKILSALIALVFILSLQAFALQGSGYPAYDGSNFSDNHMAGTFAGESLLLEFDPSAEYSMLGGGIIQACFFAFDESETHYIEMYLELPADIQSGDQFSSSDFLRNITGSASISFYEIDLDTETLYYAGSMLGTPYPASSSYEINLAEVTAGDTSVEARGTLSAVLIRFDGTEPSAETITLTDVQFHFLLPVGAAAVTPQPASPAPEKAPDSGKDPLPNFNPTPAFTLPPDYITL